MRDLTLFADRSPEEIEAIFDAYAERDFEDLPHDVFFGILALMDQAEVGGLTHEFASEEEKKVKENEMCNVS